MTETALARQNQFLQNLKDGAKYYINTPEKAAEALLLCRNAEKVIAEIKASIKERAVKKLDETNEDNILFTIVDPETGEVRQWKMARDYDKESVVYDARFVLEALGEKALPFLTVGKTKLDFFLKKALMKKEVTHEQVDKIKFNTTTKKIRGAGVRLTELKPDQIEKV